MTNLPWLVVWILKGVLPPRHRRSTIADLDVEYGESIAAQSPAAARRWLMRETTSLVLAYMTEGVRHVTRWPALWTRDVQLVGRALRRRPFASIGGAAMLSSGLVAVLITLGLASTLLFRPVSTTHPDALRRIGVNRQGTLSLRLAFAELAVIREHMAGAAQVAAVNLQPVVIRTAGVDVQTMIEVVDGDYFRVTGMRAAIGRGLMSEDERLDAAPVIVLSTPFWRNRYASSPDVLGSAIHLNGAAYTVVGVSQTLGSSSFLGASVDGWIPAAHADPVLSRGWRTSLTERTFNAFAVSDRGPAALDSRLATATMGLQRLFPDVWREQRLQSAPGTVLFGAMRSRVALVTAVLAGLSLLILSVAAANISSVLLARAASERRSAVIQLSIGSGRGPLVRRLLIEGGALGCGGALIAIGIYVWARTRFAEIAVLPTLALRFDLPLDLALMSTVIVVGTGAGALLAIGPAMWLARLDPATALRESDARGHTGFATFRRTLVSAQVCLSLALLAGAAAFTRSSNAMNAVDLGFSRDGLIAMDFDLEPSGPANGELPMLAALALERVRALPNIKAAAMSNRAPVDVSTPAVEIRSDSPERVSLRDVSFNLATTGYFETVGVPIVAGRSFTETETATGADVAIVNESLASRLWPDGTALDRTLSIDADGDRLRVVGIARDAKYRSLTEQARPHFYRPTPPRLGLALLARASGDPREALRHMQRALDAVGPGLVGFFPRTFDDHIAIELAAARTAASAASLLGTMALLLSGVGLYGIVAWFVELKRREIGIRVALGASRGNVRSLVVRQALTAAAPGIVAGLLLATGLGFAARSLLFGVSPVDPIALGGASALLACVVLIASYLPSVRATRVDPAVVLRQ